ncbi:MAG TPA: ABC transporter permease [Steroidobacteraceae bacterium]|nr:ABC transporter permease [Steroidobacteraceae bacterium]
MLRHYLIMAARSLVKHKLYSFINVVGLAVALACAILILLFVQDQLSYDAWIPDTANLYRLEVTFLPPGVPPARLALCPFAVLTAVGQRIAGVKAVTHVVPEKMTVTAGARQFPENVTVVDPNFFRVIKLPLVAGNPARVLAQPESIVLSQSEAHKYFGEQDPVGKVLKVSGVFPGACKASDSACFSAVHALTVTGVLRDLPHGTQLVADFVVPNTSRADELPNSYKYGGWTGTGGDYGYVELRKGVAPATVLAALEPILDQSIDVAKSFGVKLTGSQLEHYDLTPFRDVHLTSDRYLGMKPGGSWTTIYGFTAVAFLIVLVACSNFMNLATARATLRAREVAVRKVAGAQRRQLMAQFLGETLLTALLSLAIALSAAEVLLPAYDRFLGEPIAFHYLANWKALCAIAVGVIGVGVVSGLYPALVLSAFRPASSLKPGGSGQSGSVLLRSILVVCQFAVSIGLGIAVIVVFRQIGFARALNLGFDRYGLIIVHGSINLPPSERERMERLLRSGPGIAGTTLSSGVPFDNGQVNNLFVAAEGQPQTLTAEFYFISPSFPSLYGMRLLAGRFLSAEHGTDLRSTAGVNNVLINAEAARRFGYAPSAAIGRMLVAGNTHLRVVGVLGNAITDGLTSPVQPAIFMQSPDDTTLLSVRVRPGELPEALAYLDRTWHSIAPNVAIDRNFFSDRFNQLFASDERTGTIFGAFVGIAVFIACLGLFGLVVFTAERRTKEVGIRKIVGARSADIVSLMLWRTSVPVVTANIIAWPIAYYYLRHWLEGYAYHIELSPIYFLVAAGAALAITWVTVYANTLRLARTSPVEALRYE